MDPLAAAALGLAAHAGLEAQKSEEVASDPFASAVKGLAVHAGLEKKKPAKEAADPLAALTAGLVAHAEEVKQRPPVWGEELDDPFLGPRIALAAEDAMKSIQADWGPVFVYGPMLLPAVWGHLIGRVPDMAPARLPGFVRRGLICSGEAALVPEEDGFAIGQVVYGLLPWERRLMDSVIEDTFSMETGLVQLIEDDERRDLEVTLYVWREEFLDGITDDDWSIETFEAEWLPEFALVCQDMREHHKTNKLGDEELKETLLVGRRSQKFIGEDEPVLDD
mmetsp:Transcript_14848/g.30889  ORF Transcript_14848/g.30889 Transcript_14848/m.30889 type:complete len:279 (+) Transcript_14848:36-872(+)